MINLQSIVNRAASIINWATGIKRYNDEIESLLLSPGAMAIVHQPGYEPISIGKKIKAKGGFWLHVFYFKDDDKNIYAFTFRFNKKTGDFTKERVEKLSPEESREFEKKLFPDTLEHG